MGLITPVELPGLDQLGSVHFIAIGGSGMNGIASMMLSHGIRVSGSDRQDSKYLRALEAQGARVYVGHRAEQLGDAADGGRLVGYPGGQPRADGGSAPRPAGAAPQCGAGFADARPPWRRSRGNTRQDHDHGDDRARAHRLRIQIRPSSLVGALTGSATGGHLGGGDVVDRRG